MEVCLCIFFKEILSSVISQVWTNRSRVIISQVEFSKAYYGKKIEPISWHVIPLHINFILASFLFCIFSFFVHHKCFWSWGISQELAMYCLLSFHVLINFNENLLFQLLTTYLSFFLFFRLCLVFCSTSELIFIHVLFFPFFFYSSINNCIE